MPTYADFYNDARGSDGGVGEGGPVKLVSE